MHVHTHTHVRVAMLSIDEDAILPAGGANAVVKATDADAQDGTAVFGSTPQILSRQGQQANAFITSVVVVVRALCWC